MFRTIHSDIASGSRAIGLASKLTFNLFEFHFVIPKSISFRARKKQEERKILRQLDKKPTLPRSVNRSVTQEAIDPEPEPELHALLVQDIAGRTPLDVAFAGCAQDAAELLLRHGSELRALAPVAPE